MWIFTKYGFFSIACANDAGGKIDPDKVMVRTRLREHLDSLKERFPKTVLGQAEIQVSEHTDYRYRIVVPKADWVAALAELATEQTWANFKTEAGRFSIAKKKAHAYVDALHSIWDVMHRLQMKEDSGTRAAKSWGYV
jgi:hypothetical protein